MTTLQKTVVTATVAVLAGAGIYEARQASNARAEAETLRQQHVPLSEQIQHLARERDDATNRVAAFRDEIERLNRNQSELLRLRSEVGMLRGLTNDYGKRPGEDSRALTNAVQVSREDHFRLQTQDRRGAMNTLAIAMSMFARDHNQQVPSNLTQLTEPNLLGWGYKNGQFQGGIPLDAFELVRVPTSDKRYEPWNCFLRERVPRQTLNGKWARFYVTPPRPGEHVSDQVHELLSNDGIFETPEPTPLTR